MGSAAKSWSCCSPVGQHVHWHTHMTRGVSILQLLWGPDVGCVPPTRDSGDNLGQSPQALELSQN